jgi:hypothetical protein
MPVRLLMYAGKWYERHLSPDEASRHMLYGRRLVRIPKPEFVVLCTAPHPGGGRETLRLSDAYAPAAPSALRSRLELSVPVYYISEAAGADDGAGASAEAGASVSAGDGTTLGSRYLGGYVAFVEASRRYRAEFAAAGLDADAAARKGVAKAIRHCVEHGILAEFLAKYESRNGAATDKVGYALGGFAGVAQFNFQQIPE